MALKSMTASACVVALLATGMPATAAPLGFQPTQIDVKNEQIVEVGHYKRKKRRHHHHHGHGAGIALGIIGLAAGLAIAGSSSHDRHYYRSCPAPWTRAWYRSCSRFRTFDPHTGYYYYAPGRQRFCEC